MKDDDQQLGKPLRLYRDIKANIEGLSLDAGDEGCEAYATDTNEFGTFDGSSWTWGTTGPADISARAYHDANQAIPHSVETTLAFNQERWDTDAIHDLVVNNNRLTCKTAGTYLIGANTVWEHHIAGDRILLIRFNGVTEIGHIRLPTTNNWNLALSLSTCYQLAVNDFVEVRVYQESGGVLNLRSHAQYSPEFWMVRMPG